MIFKLSSFSDSKVGLLVGQPQTWWRPRQHARRLPRWWFILSEYEGSPCHERTRIQEVEVRNWHKTLSGFLDFHSGKFRAYILSTGFRLTDYKNNKYQALQPSYSHGRKNWNVGLIEWAERKSVSLSLSAIKCTSLKQICFGKIPIGEIQSDSPLARPPVTIQGIRNLFA